jgi:hypothetical protein
MIEAPVTRLLKGGGHAVADKRSPPHVAEGGCEEHPAGICARLVIGGAAHQKVALFKGVRERKGPPKFLIVHDFATLSRTPSPSLSSYGRMVSFRPDNESSPTPRHKILSAPDRLLSAERS